MAFELQQLRQALALARHGSFVRAAGALHISQPALSRSIQNLERSFGSQLFERTPGGVVPTDLGRLYLERARELLRIADELDRESIRDRRLASGRLSFGGGPIPSAAFLGRAIARFAKDHPAVSVHLLSRDWEELLIALRAREIDYFIAETSTLLAEVDLDVQALPSRHPMYWIGRAGHELAQREALTLKDLLAYPLAAPPRIPPRIFEPLIEAHRDAHPGRASAPFPAVRCSSQSTLKQVLAHSDLVTATMPSCFAAELESGQLVILHSQATMRLEYGLVSVKGCVLSEAAVQMRRYIIEAEHDCAVEEGDLVARLLRRGISRKARRSYRVAS